MKENILINFEIPNNINLTDNNKKNIDNYLTKFFLINIDELTKKDINLKTVIQRVLKLNLSFLQAIKIPIFEEGLIEEFEDNKKTKKTRIIISLKSIKYISINAYKNIFNESLNIFFNFLIKPISKSNISILNNIIQKKIIKPHLNIAGSSKSSIVILETVYNLGIPYRHLGRGLYVIGEGKESVQLLSSSIGSDSKIGSQVVGNKMITALMLKDLGLPYPIHKLINKKEQCLNASEIIGFPLVVKPVDENEGRGVYIDIENVQQLYKAFEKAKTFSKSGQILVEKQVKGTCYRIFIVKQTILYVVKRHPKSIKGDGISKIEELIGKENLKNELLVTWKRTEPYPCDKLTIEVLSKLNLTLDSIPEKDIWIPLRKIESTQDGGRNEDLTNNIHPENIDIALRAANLFGMDVAGIDVISEDISIPWHKNGAIINEVNFAPQLGRDDFTKDKIISFVKTIIRNDGKIPIKAIIGKNEALNKAKQLQEKSLNKGIVSYVTTHDKTFSSSGIEIYYETILLKERIDHLLLQKDIDELIIVIQNNDFQIINSSDYDEIIILEKEEINNEK
ncbi:ATP-grasp domain-containing protein [Poseidonibacter lekithochrous]|uniref:ATP-grasp domain-containing protein n=1 Tax=Poseidonibacter TaxID=2321187 RepID=UPI001C0A4E23|nr:MULTISPECIES: ATP-grasp domain-containing protein [Poseidonibacter]MBU3014247.1 ATP-grasp domain-containing protein [Poseidonibacter lekithochrous]MDO6827544.1 ATP-grasp domain-containing protein [Poseidonibacter sp. 1_MG-2023]